MDRRLILQKKLEEILGSRNVYFQPPEGVKMNYPCFVYQLSGANIIDADDTVYRYQSRYTMTAIVRKPDEIKPESIIAALSHCRFDRHFTSDGLHHFVFTLYF